MAIQRLLEQHAEIGELMTQSEKTKWPPDSLALAKQAAVKSHELAGKLLAVAVDFDNRITKLEAALRE
ncbi:hypothetical protein G3465_15215 [Shewanella baltica]|uniref:hypothetical protein n=1 Tax=Shewanella baltica TaxID=62322 RepID=UPI00217DC51A|nr:hypothetical protein [Shewanella baltica]MCS6154242.1 hypothetical protein [Shewanella baltica]